MTSSKIKNIILKTILAPWYREWLKQWKYQKVFVFSVEGFEFFKFYEKEAKPDIRKFKRGLALYPMFKIREITGKIGFQFCKLTFSGLGEQTICKFA